VIGPDSIADRSVLFPPNFESHLENPTRVSVDRRSRGRRVDRDAARACDGDAPGAVPSPPLSPLAAAPRSLRYFDAT
jgi:hypothetical protein